MLNRVLPCALSSFIIDDYRQLDITFVKGLERTLVIIFPKWRFLFCHIFSPNGNLIALEQGFAFGVDIELFLRLHINSVY